MSHGFTAATGITQVNYLDLSAMAGSDSKQPSGGFATEHCCYI